MELELSLCDVVWFCADCVLIIILEQKLPVNAENIKYFNIENVGAGAETGAVF